MSEAKTYTIGGKTYVQRELVLGQWRQLKPLLDDLRFASQDNMMLSLLQVLEDKGRLEAVVAVLITEEGMIVENKSVGRLAEKLKWSLTPDLAGEILNDFFTCNPVASIVERLGTVLDKIGHVVAMRTMLAKTPLTKSAASSRGETSAAGIESSGDSLPGNASHTCSTLNLN